MYIATIMLSEPTQLPLSLGPAPRGGRRPGAGRKPGPGKRPTPHRARPEITRHQVVHVSLRVGADLPRLRGPDGYAAVRRGVAACIGRLDLRIVHASIQHNHVHLLVEADDKRALRAGLQAFMIATTRCLNRRLGRHGAVFVGRYHMTVLTTPRQVRNTLLYVLNNWRRHGEDRRGPAQRRAPLDPYATGLRFDGWRDVPDPATAFPPRYEPLPVAGPRSWLLTTGWHRHHPPLGTRDVPGPLAGPRRRAAMRT